MRIIIDGFGGDNAPLEVLKGCEAAVKEYGVQLIVTGSVEKLKACASENSVSLEGVTFADALSVFPMEAEPTTILKEHADSSMAEGFRRLAAGEGDAFVTAGSTGAAVVGATFIVKRIKGIKRAAIGIVIPSSTGCYMLLDSGANHDCRPEMLKQFGIMGSAYMEKVIGVASPRVGVINIGTEETKGTDLQIEANRLLKQTDLNFIGNVEARELPLGGCEVAVCDGFTGNIILKMIEGLARMFMDEIKSVFMKNTATKLAALAVKPSLREFKAKFDYTEYGGAMLLGVRKPVIKAHGSSNAKAFKNAVRQAMACCGNDVIGCMEAELSGAEETAGD